LNRLLILAVGDGAFVLPQLPLAAADDSEPEPDLALVPAGDYEREHPRTALLVIEIADSSVRKDRNIKAPIYAAAGVAEYWIVFVSERVVEVHREPRDGRYGRVETIGRGAVIELVGLPGVRIATDDFL
jgi:Uma2 family endonuclease